MANFLARLALGAKPTEPSNRPYEAIAPVPDLRLGCETFERVHLQWACARNAPLSIERRDTGITWLVGCALDRDGGRVGADALARLDDTSASPDGFFVSLSYAPSTGLRVRTDLLGAFPVYYAQSRDAILIASSPALLEDALPSRQLDLAGAASLLLFSFTAGRSALLRGVTRLGRGRTLSWEPGQGLRELTTLPALLSREHFDELFEAQVEQLGTAVRRALQRHVEPERLGSVLLTGGRDSRLLVGLLPPLSEAPRAITFGLPGDADVELARRLAEQSECEHRIAEIEMEEMPRHASRCAEWEHGGVSLGSAVVWGEASLLVASGPEVLVGHMLSSVIGGMHILDAFAAPGSKPSFSNVLESIGRWGISPEQLTALLKDPYASDVVQSVVAERRACFEEGLEDDAAQRAWRFDLFHRQSSMLGGSLWRYSFAAWPVVPALTLDLLRLCGGLPVASLARRRAQDELLLRRLPALSGVPIDQLVRTMLEGRHSAAVRALMPRLAGPQRLKRLSDLDGPIWREIRRAAEPGREAALEYLHRDSLEQLLPGPDAPVGGDIYRWTSRKALLELFLWLAGS